VIGAVVRLAGRTVLPFNGRTGYVKSVTSDRWIVLVTLADGSRQEIAVVPTDVVVVQAAPKAPKK